jgi:hypothetical protein
LSPDVTKRKERKCIQFPLESEFIPAVLPKMRRKQTLPPTHPLLQQALDWLPSRWKTIRF